MFPEGVIHKALTCDPAALMMFAGLLLFFIIFAIAAAVSTGRELQEACREAKIPRKGRR